LRQYAIDHNFVIATKDADFYEMNLVYGPPPQVLWLKIGNQSKSATIKALLENTALIEQALIQDSLAFVEIV
jgi:predicted nuclease of predicted toxin-antitoxin system